MFGAKSLLLLYEEIHQVLSLQSGHLQGTQRIVSPYLQDSRAFLKDMDQGRSRS